jgi:hypothetical protein
MSFPPLGQEAGKAAPEKKDHQGEQQPQDK